MINKQSNKNKFFIKSFGCQYNEWDAVRLAFVLKNMGLVESTKDEANIVFLLNCSVRKTGVDRTLGMARNLISEDKKVILTGCILDADKPRFETKGVILWDGEDYDKLSEFLNIQNDLSSIIKTNDYSLETSHIPIMKGCNNFCSYCAVPYTRGRETSRPIDDVLADVRKLLASGANKVFLLGQNVNSYKSQQSVVSSKQEAASNSTTALSAIPAYSSVIPAYSSVIPAKAGIQAEHDLSQEQTGDKVIGFAELLTEINSIDGDFTIEFSSNHPKDMSDEIIEAIATLSKVEKIIHLPVQSGSNKILKAMNRPYTREQYLALVDKIKRRIPNIKITTDTIIGFPGETEEDFQETVDLFRQVGFAQAFNNKYSPREGTAAFELGDPVPWREKQRRWRILDEISFHKK
jgi:tRNA-2-methylthio-N6-dimethylallyladenosine synthase